jgi:hypothetical protein
MPRRRTGPQWCHVIEHEVIEKNVTVRRVGDDDGLR